MCLAAGWSQPITLGEGKSKLNWVGVHVSDSTGKISFFVSIFRKT